MSRLKYLQDLVADAGKTADEMLAKYLGKNAPAGAAQIKAQPDWRQREYLTFGQRRMPNVEGIIKGDEDSVSAPRHIVNRLQSDSYWTIHNHPDSAIEWVAKDQPTFTNAATPSIEDLLARRNHSSLDKPVNALISSEGQTVPVWKNPITDSFMVNPDWRRDSGKIDQMQKDLRKSLDPLAARIDPLGHKGAEDAVKRQHDELKTIVDRIAPDNDLGGLEVYDLMYPARFWRYAQQPTEASINNFPRLGYDRNPQASIEAMDEILAKMKEAGYQRGGAVAGLKRFT